MHYLLLIAAMLWFAFVAPLKVILATTLFVLLTLMPVRFAARAIIGMQVSFGEAAKAVSLSIVFLAIVLFTLISFYYGPKGVNIHLSGLATYAVFGSTPAAYILGYKIGLGITFGASAVIALISSVASCGGFFADTGAFLA